MKKQLVSTVVFMTTLLSANSQTPDNDPHWLSNPYFVDDFNSISSYWTVKNNDSHGTPGVDLEPQLYTSRQQNVQIVNHDSKNWLRLRAVKEEPYYQYNNVNWQYTSGWVEADENFPKYGYIEARCEMPYGQQGFWPAFWLFNGSEAGGNYSEIDIFENSSHDNHYTSNNKHYMTQQQIQAGVGHTAEPAEIHWPWFDFSGEHVWGCEWSPNTIIFYVDNLETARRTGDFMVYDLKLILNLAMFPLNGANKPYVSSSASFPVDFDIDYVKIFKLNMTNCGTNDITLINNSDFSGYQYYIKRNITIGNGSTAVTVPTNSDMTLRASNEITINNNFEVPAGTPFGLQITGCY